MSERDDFRTSHLKNVISEKWTRDGAIVECVNGIGGKVATIRQTRVPAYVEHLASTRIEVIAAAPAAVRLVLEALPLLVDLQRAAEGSSADAEVLGLHVNLSRARLAELVKLNAQVTAALEGRS